jgi:hypothetical protein
MTGARAVHTVSNFSLFYLATGRDSLPERTVAVADVDGLDLAGNLHADAPIERNVLATVEGDDAAAGADAWTSCRFGSSVEQCGEGLGREVERRDVDVCNRCSEDEGSHGEDDSYDEGYENHGVGVLERRIGIKIGPRLRKESRVRVRV